MGSVDVERGTKPKAYNNYNNNNGIYYVETSEKQWTSWLVPMIVVANVVVFIVVMSVNNCPHNNSGFEGSCVARPWRAIPLFGPSSTLEKLGALEWNKVVHDHQAWRLISCMWLHTGLIHLLGNMLSLVCLGISLEQQFGFVRVGIVYLLSGFGGSILSALFIQSNIFVGASGAVFGLLGAMLSELLTNWTIHSNKIAELWLLVSISAINLGVGIVPHVDNFAQIGGFFTGFLLGFVLLLRPQFGWAEGQNLPAGACIKHKHKAYQYTFFIIALILLIVGFMVGLVMLFRGEN